jgi:DHA3 family macrolide efflux protein-like MFS transporter
LRETAYGFRYILARRGLLGLQTVFLVTNLFYSLAGSLRAPLILARSGSDQIVFGSAQSAGAVGGLVGGLAIAAWGGPKRRLHGVLLSMAGIGLLAQTTLGLAQALPGWIVGSFLGAFFAPIANGCSQAIWQTTVAPDVQGRVFAARRLIAMLVSPLARLAAGPLADRVLEPAMVTGSGAARALGWLVGSGPGAGIGLLYVVCGCLAALTALSAYLVPAVRNVEDTPADLATAIST